MAISPDGRKMVWTSNRSSEGAGFMQGLLCGAQKLTQVAYLRREQDLDLKAFDVRFDNYYLESSLYTEGHVDATVQRLIANGKTY